MRNPNPDYKRNTSALPLQSKSIGGTLDQQDWEKLEELRGSINSSFATVLRMVVRRGMPALMRDLEEAESKGEINLLEALDA